MTRVPLAERSRYRFEATMLDTARYHVRVDSPDGGFAQWWVHPVKSEATQGRPSSRYRRFRYTAPKTARFALCMRDDPTAVIAYYPDFDYATRAANLRARKWLGSKWGLKAAARKLP